MSDILTVDGVNFFWRKTVFRPTEPGQKDTRVEIYSCRACLEQIEFPAADDLEPFAREHLDKWCRNHRGLKAV